MIFVDTGAWAAFFVPRDPSHGAAVEWMEHNEQLLITTDYILDHSCPN
jgi:predicted nucleic acid-binding protein